jgi:hypothetical protein
MPEVLIKKQFSTRDILKSLEHEGKSYGVTAGSWISDLCEAHKVITLCSACVHRWQTGIKKYNYVKDWEFPVVMAKCDDCKTFARCSIYFWEGVFRVVRSTEDERRALARSREKRIKQGYL